MRTAWLVTTAIVLFPSLIPAARADALGLPLQGAAPALAPLYRSIAADLKQGRPLVATVHVPLCDNSIIHCGSRSRGDGDDLRRNLYWGAAAGFRAYFDRARGYRRVALDGGDGRVVLQRVAYRRRVRPSARWRRLGVTKPFDLLVVGLAYRGRSIGAAMKGLLADLAGSSRDSTITLADGQRVEIGSRAHLIGYAGHNHLMDVERFAYPRLLRRQPVGYFVLACVSAQYLAPHLVHPSLHALLMTRTLMYPGAFTIDGITSAIAAGATHREVFLEGVRYYARFQKRPERIIRSAFTYGGDPRWKKMVR